MSRALHALLRTTMSCSCAVRLSDVLLVTACWCSNVKKLFNAMGHTSRSLRIGKYQMSMSQLYVLYEGTDPSSTGIWRTDVDEQRNKQNVPPVLRMVSEVG